MSSPSDDRNSERARKLGLWGTLSAWDEVGGEPWIEKLLDLEEKERAKRSLERRVRNAKLGDFKSIADFEWDWPRKVDRDLCEDVMKLGFLSEIANVIIVGPNGVGKTTIAANIGYQALMAGYAVRRITASAMLNDLAAQESSYSLARSLRRYTGPALLIVDEVGYLSYDGRQGDLLFEVVSRRHEAKSMVLTTNKPFSEWSETFPNSSCVTALVDRLVHRAEIISIDGDSYRAKEARERNARKARERREKKKPASTKNGRGERKGGS